MGAGAGVNELGAGSGELGVGSGELGAGSGAASELAGGWTAVGTSIAAGLADGAALALGAVALA